MENIFAVLVIVVSWAMSIFIGVPLVFGLVHFEKYGGDPLKRSIIDMASTFFTQLVRIQREMFGVLIICGIESTLLLEIQGNRCYSITY